jgi:hypothetical protein
MRKRGSQRSDEDDEDADFDEEPQRKKSGLFRQNLDLSAASNLALGSSCHQCKSRRRVDDLIFCHFVADKKSKGCRKKYCEHCLRKFYREEVSEIPDRSTWSCPSCRKICCCAACRRKEQKDKLVSVPCAVLTAQGPGGSFPFSSPGDAFYPGSAAVPFPSGDLALGVASPDDASSQTSFALLYAVAQMPSVQKLINDILKRTDITDSEKVESIATLLRSAVQSGSE